MEADFLSSGNVSVSLHATSLHVVDLGIGEAVALRFVDLAIVIRKEVGAFGVSSFRK